MAFNWEHCTSYGLGSTGKIKYLAPFSNGSGSFATISFAYVIYIVEPECDGLRWCPSHEHHFIFYIDIGILFLANVEDFTLPFCLIFSQGKVIFLDPNNIAVDKLWQGKLLVTIIYFKYLIIILHRSDWVGKTTQEMFLGCSFRPNLTFTLPFPLCVLSSNFLTLLSLSPLFDRSDR